MLGIISTNSDLDKAKTMTEDEARTFGIFNRIQFWLGVVEAAVIGLQIGFEIFGAAGAATVCGVLGVGKWTRSQAHAVECGERA